MARKKQKIKKIPDPSDMTLLARKVYCGSCGRMMHRRRTTWELREAAFSCVYDFEENPPDNPCATFRYPVFLLYQDVYAAIRKEQKTALRTSGKLKGGIKNEQYQLVKQFYQNRLFLVMDQIRDIVKQKNELYMTLPLKGEAPSGFAKTNRRQDAEIQKLTKKMIRIFDDFLVLHTLYTTENPWLRLYTKIPEDFILDHQLIKKTVEKIIIYPEREPVITLKLQESRDQLFQSLKLVARICREETIKKEGSEHGE